MNSINWNRVLLGGIAAGIVAILLMIVVISPILMPSWEMGMKMGLWKQPGATNFIIGNVNLLFFGLVATFTYAAVRPRFGGTANTAILTGILIAVLKDIIPGIGRWNWSAEPGENILLWIALSSASTVVATFVGAWIYKE